MKTINQYITDNIKDYEGILTGDDHQNLQICSLTYELEQEGLISFQAVHRENENSDHWVQVEYHSLKIDKTIIWDHDIITEFDEVADLVEWLETTEKEIKDFDAQLPDLSVISHIE